MTREREKNLDDTLVAGIVKILDGWTGKLRWEALLDAIERREGLRYTRQTLHRHEKIRLAFTVRKKALAGLPELCKEVARPYRPKSVIGLRF